MTELVVITDSDLPRDDGMVEILELAGFRVTRADARTEDDVIAAAADAVGLIVQWAHVGERTFAALPRLRAISRLGIGVDMVDTDAATRYGVAVANTPDYCIEEVAVHALALAFALLRGIAAQDGALRAGRWEPVAGYPAARRPSSTTIGVVGFGRIGRRVARGARAAGFRVLVHDIGPVAEDASDAGAELVEFDELVAASDLLTLHAPLTPTTRHLLNADTIAQMKRGAFVVNTTRGGLVDEQALAAALEQGHLGGAGLDVFEEEPLPLHSPLRRAPRTVLTPHSAWYSPDALRELPRRATENLVVLLAGKDIPALLNPDFAHHLRSRQLDAR
jgi:D-3-phosphoglycerate dehydrogenase / 2-oxoglutarate reductase